MCLFGIVGNKIASIQNNQTKAFFIYAILLNISLVLIGTITNYSTIIFIIMLQCFFSVTGNIYNTSIQNECDDSYRQTILAIFTFLISISEMIIASTTSIILKNINLGQSYIALGVFGLIGILIVLVYYLKRVCYNK